MDANFDRGMNLLNRMEDDIQIQILYESENTLVYSDILRDLALKGNLKELNTMIKYVPSIDSTQFLPKFLVGDPDRL